MEWFYRDCGFRAWVSFPMIGKLFLCAMSAVVFVPRLTRAQETDTVSQVTSYLYYDAAGEDTNAPVASSVMSYLYSDAIGSDTNSVVASPVMSFLYYDAPGVDMNSAVLSRVVSYLYYDWLGDENLTFQNSPLVSYLFQIGNGAPFIVTQPYSQFVQAGSTTTFGVLADGQPPLHYQWHNGTGILANATNSSLTITNAQADASYYVVVSNPYGSVTSQSAQLKILVDYNTAIATPLSPTPPKPPPKPPSQHNLVVVTHGWQPIGIPQWVYDMTNSIGNNLPDSSWTVFALSWNGADGAGTFLPQTAASRAEIIGKKFGLGISAQGWSHVHFIGHSAGAVLIQAAAEELIANSASPVEIHTTFLDPYDWSRFGGPSRFGAGSAWSDNYFENDPSGPLTGGQLDNSYNVDISHLDPHPFYHPIDQHNWAYEFYQKTITSLPIIYEGLGFTLSKEGGNWNYAINNYHRGDPPYLLGGGSALYSSSVPIQSYPALVVSALTSLWNGSVYVTLNGFDLFTSLISPRNAKDWSTNTFGSPVWLSLGITVTNQINFVRFDARFTSATNSAGLLTVYWNTNEIGVADETVTTPGLQNYSFALPASYSSGNYVLGFRLDSFENIVSSISITNVTLGFAGLTNTVTLGINRAGGSNQLTLTGPTNYNYLVESSSNLVDWIPTAIVANTNGTVLFPIPAATNSNAQFYRAVSP